MEASNNLRIGIIGFGFIGSNLFHRISSNRDLGIDVEFVLNSKSKKSEIDAPFVSSIEEGMKQNIQLVVEVATPMAYTSYALKVLAKTDFMGFSLSALAEKPFHEEVLEAAEKYHTRLFIPHGAVFGLDGIASHLKLWKSVTVTTTKPPGVLKVTDCKERKLVFEGSTREACKLFPRSVNSHAAVALGGIGFDRQISKVYADPAITNTTQSIEAIAEGFTVSVTRASELVGVSGTGMIDAVLGSILRVAKKSGAVTI